MIGHQGDSGAYWQSRAERVLAGGCLTFSKSKRYYVESQPSHVCGGDQQYLISAYDGTQFFDTVSGLGANLIDCRRSYSLPDMIEVILAEELLRRIPLWKDGKVKFVKTGTEACMAAIRFGRASGRGIGVATTGYHGWGNEFIESLPGAVGCGCSDVERYQSIKELIEDIESDCSYSCVIVEPVELDENVIEDLKKLRSICTQTKTILIFDEVITGLRWKNLTVSQDFGITPDILVLGKALGGGYPIGVVMGPSSIMDIEGVFVSGTFAGEVTAMQSALSTLSQCTISAVHMFWEQCRNFHNYMRYICGNKMDILGYGTRMVFKSPKDDGLTVAKYMQEMYTRHKILIGPVMFPKITWTGNDFSKISRATEDVIRDIDSVELIGEKPRPIFKR